MPDNDVHRAVIDIYVFEDLGAEETAERINDTFGDELDQPMTRREHSPDRKPVSQEAARNARRTRHLDMADVEKLLSEYIAEHRAGGAADPIEYLDQLQGTDRDELALLIDAYLARSPGRSWDREAFSGSTSERLTESLARSFEGASGLWPTILPRLRDRAQITRGALVHRLAEALGVADHEQKVEGYYHEMEQGLLPSAGVSPRS